MPSTPRVLAFVLLLGGLLVSTLLRPPVAKAQEPAPHGTLAPTDNTAQSLPYSQNWTDTSLITTDDDWSGVSGVVGYRGDGLTSSNDVDPRTVLADGTTTPVDVNANQTNPNTFTTGGVAEFHITDATVALQGSSTASAPFLLINLNTTGRQSITVSYTLRDIDGSADNAAQQIALHYRVGNSGAWTNVPAAYVADATTGPNLAVLTTAVSVVLPAAANNQPLVQIRVMTTNTTGSDESVGVDDIAITSSPTAVTLASLDAISVGSYVAVTWETASELDNLGFNLYRGTVSQASSTPINATLIPSSGPGSSEGFFYEWMDGDVEEGQTYFYWLEDVALDGERTLHGPAIVLHQAPTAITMAALDSRRASSSLVPALALLLAGMGALGWQCRRRG